MDEFIKKIQENSARQAYCFTEMQRIVNKQKGKTIKAHIEYSLEEYRKDKYSNLRFI